MKKHNSFGSKEDKKELKKVLPKSILSTLFGILLIWGSITDNWGAILFIPIILFFGAFCFLAVIGPIILLINGGWKEYNILGNHDK
jgi:hypothetical protein